MRGVPSIWPPAMNDPESAAASRLNKVLTFTDCPTVRSPPETRARTMPSIPTRKTMPFLLMSIDS